MVLTVTHRDPKKTVLAVIAAVSLMLSFSYPLSKPHTKFMVDPIRLLIEKGNAETLTTLSEECLSKEHATGPAYDAFRKAVLIPDQTARIQFLNQELGPAKMSPSKDINHPKAGANPNEHNCALKLLDQLR